MTEAADSTCPTSGQECKNEHGMRIHHATAHGESLVEKTSECDHCGEEFEVPAGSTGKYCSNECNALALRDRVEVECDNCGDVFEAEAKVAADGRKFCSHDCYAESLRARDEYECESCGRDYSVYRSAGIKYCSRACMAQARTSKPRPDELEGLLWLLYVYEDHNVRETWLRANGNLDDWITLDEVRERLRANHWMVAGSRPKYGDLTLEDVGLAGSSPDGDDTWEKYQYNRGESA